MPTLEVIGAPQSNFVRTVRIACVEKSVPYALNAIGPHTPEVDAINPFGKIPVMRHGDVALSETKAICTYIDLAFDGPPLIPRDPVGAAKTEQWISMVTTGFDLVFVRQYLVAYVFSGLPDGAPDRARIDAALPRMREMFGTLDRELGRRAYLAGAAFTLADMFLLPIVHYLNMTPESSEMLKASPNVMAWFQRVSARPSAIETVVPPPGRNRG
jgi:glutathione S-transferase